MMKEEHCDFGYGCVADVEDRALGTSQCRYCGKQLDLIDGKWFTWDARFLPEDQRRPQLEERHAMPEVASH